MLQLFVSLLSFTLERVWLRLPRNYTWFLNPWGKKSHEVLVVDQVTVLIHYSNRNNVIVGIDLVHQCSHHD